VIAEDFELVKAIFQLVEAGIVHGYDAFRYRVEWGVTIWRQTSPLKKMAQKSGTLKLISTIRKSMRL
jgi:hypothetical protein